MPNPKRQHSRQRGKKRRTHWKVTLANMSVCPNCHKEVLPHRVCPFCGHYKGKLVIEIKAKKEKKPK